jgi:hypothetical protein
VEAAVAMLDLPLVDMTVDLRRLYHRTHSLISQQPEPKEAKPSTFAT